MHDIREKRGDDIVASFKGFSGNPDHICRVLRHNDRTNFHYSNEDIDTTKSNQNYILSPERDITPSEYFKQKIDEYWHYNRSDVKLMDEWIITAPKELSASQERDFFQSCYTFLNERYCGEQNCILAAVHKDESGRPHLHYDFVPVVKNTNIKHKADFKICNKEVVNRTDLRNFHDDLQTFLEKKGFTNCNVHSGITQQIGQNLTIQQLKAIRSIEKEFTPEQLRKVIPILSEEYHHDSIAKEQQEHEIFQSEDDVWNYGSDRVDIEEEEEQEWF